MTVNAVTACCRFFSDSGAVLGARITTGGVRRFRQKNAAFSE
jgi:hypothetical protein